MYNVLLKTLIKFKLKFFGVLIEEEAFWCLFHLSVVFASLSGLKHLHLYKLNIVVLMLTFGLETLRKLYFFLTLYYTLICAEDIVKQIRHSFTVYFFLETRKVLFTLSSQLHLQTHKLRLIFKRFSFYSPRTLVSYICKCAFLHHPDFLPFVLQALITFWRPITWIWKFKHEFYQQTLLVWELPCL